MVIHLSETENKGHAFVGEEANPLAEMTYSKAGIDKIIIDHTSVDDSLKGKGVGRQLLLKIVEMARDKDLKILPLCPFAKAQFRKDESIRGVLA